MPWWLSVTGSIGEDMMVLTGHRSCLRGAYLSAAGKSGRGVTVGYAGCTGLDDVIAGFGVQDSYLFHRVSLLSQDPCL